MFFVFPTTPAGTIAKTVIVFRRRFGSFGAAA